MQVERPVADAFRPFHEPRRVAVLPSLAKEVRVDMYGVVPSCSVCGVAVRQNAASKACGDKLCQGCRRSRKSSWEDVRPASPMAGKPRDLGLEKPVPHKPADRRVHPGSKWTPVTEVESEPESVEDCSLDSASFRAEGGSFRTMEVLSCFQAEAARGLRLVLRIMTAERWYAWWAILLSLLLWPILLTLAVVAGVGFLVLSTWVAIACAVVYPLAYIHPKLYDYAMDS